MQLRYQYLLFAMLLAIVYEIYLVGLYKYRDFQVNSYISALVSENAKTADTIERKKEYLAYVKTNAYLDRAAKASQNRKNPGEEAVFLVNEADMKNYARIDVEKTIVPAVRKEASRTAGMSNREKWLYYGLRIE